MNEKIWYISAIIPMVTIIYSAVIFTQYPPAYTEKRRVGGSRRNPQTFNWYNNITLVGNIEWDAPDMDEYQHFGFKSCEGNAAPASIDVKDDNTCTQNISNTLAARARWRGSTRPPDKPSFKLKLHRCVCNVSELENGTDADCEWKKFKIDNSSCILNTSLNNNYQGEATDEWTLRSDRHDFLNIYDLFAWRFFRFMGGRDFMWSTIVTLNISSSSMGMYQLTTSPEKDILPDNADIFWEYTDDSEPNPWGRPKLDLKEPDNCDDDPNSTDCAEDSAAFINVINTFENGSAKIDVPSFAARVWLQAMTSDGDAEKSLYFYTQKNNDTIYAGPAWDSGFAYNSPEFRCLFVKLADPDGWVPEFYRLYEPYFNQLRPACTAAWKARDVAAFIDDFEDEVRSNYTELIRYDWELWRHVEDFECWPSIFQEESYSRAAGGHIWWKLEGIDHQLTLFFEYLRNRHAFLDSHHEDLVGSDRRASISWGPLFVAFVTLSTFSIVVISVSALILIKRKQDTVDYSIIKNHLF